MARRIKKDDEVVVIAGKDKGKRGRVLAVQYEKDRAVVEGVNMKTRHLRRNPQNPAEGGRVENEASIHLSNLMPWSDSDNKGVRVGFEDNKEGKKHRVSRASGAPIGTETATSAKKKDDA